MMREQNMRILELEDKVISLITSHDALKDKVKRLEKKVESKSLVIHGVPEEDNETFSQTETNMKNVLKQIGVEGVLLDNVT